MATLKDFFDDNPYNLVLPDMVKKYGLVNFLETGTGMGDSVDYARPFFDMCYSFECYDQIYELAYNRFYGMNDVKIIHADTSEKLYINLYKLGIQKPTFFFLDAHFPGADFHYESYTEYMEYAKKYPLESEVDQVLKVKRVERDVFVIDDLWLYEPGGDYGAKDCPVPKDHLPDPDTIKRVHEMLKKTHNELRDLRYQGFLIYLPKMYFQ